VIVAANSVAVRVQFGRLGLVAVTAILLSCGKPEGHEAKPAASNAPAEAARAGRVAAAPANRSIGIYLVDTDGQFERSFQERTLAATQLDQTISGSEVVANGKLGEYSRSTSLFVAAGHGELGLWRLHESNNTKYTASLRSPGPTEDNQMPTAVRFGEGHQTQDVRICACKVLGGGKITTVPGFPEPDRFRPDEADNYGKLLLDYIEPALGPRLGSICGFATDLDCDDLRADLVTQIASGQGSSTAFVTAISAASTSPEVPVCLTNAALVSANARGKWLQWREQARVPEAPSIWIMELLRWDTWNTGVSRAPLATQRSTLINLFTQLEAANIVGNLAAGQGQALALGGAQRTETTWEERGRASVWAVAFAKRASGRWLRLDEWEEARLKQFAATTQGIQAERLAALEITEPGRESRRIGDGPKVITVPARPPNKSWSLTVVPAETAVERARAKAALQGVPASVVPTVQVVWSATPGESAAYLFDYRKDSRAGSQVIRIRVPAIEP